MSGENLGEAVQGEAGSAPEPKKLSPAAMRALAEAEERRRIADAARAAAPTPREINGPKGARSGAEPTRYGDWEIKGILSDF